MYRSQGSSPKKKLVEGHWTPEIISLLSERVIDHMKFTKINLTLNGWLQSLQLHCNLLITSIMLKMHVLQSHKRQKN